MVRGPALRAVAAGPATRREAGLTTADARWTQPTIHSPGYRAAAGAKPPHPQGAHLPVQACQALPGSRHQCQAAPSSDSLGARTLAPGSRRGVTFARARGRARGQHTVPTMPLNAGATTRFCISTRVPTSSSPGASASSSSVALRVALDLYTCCAKQKRCTIRAVTSRRRNYLWRSRPNQALAHPFV